MPFRKAAENELVSQNPTAIPTEVSDAAGFASKDLARSMRRWVWNRWGGMLNWSRLSEQLFRVDKWSVCRG